jgi:chromate transporter
MGYRVLLDLFMAFLRSSMLSYGGGPASIPLMRVEIVDRYRWLTNEGFADALAMGNALPGPIAPKMAAYVGYHAGGVPGALVGVVATVAPTAVLMVLLAGLLVKWKDSPRMKGMLAVAKPIVVALLAQTTLEMVSAKVYPSWVSALVTVLALGAVLVLKVHPALVVFAGLALGFAFSGWFV